MSRQVASARFAQEARRAQVHECSDNVCFYALFLLCSLLCSFAIGDEITVFFTANELGQLKPCGCSGGQLGGLDRRFAVLNAVVDDKRLIFDAGSLVADSTDQDLIKFNIIVQAYGLLGYDVVNLTEKDILNARQAGLLDGMCQLFKCISAEPVSEAGAKFPAKFTKEFFSGDKKIEVTVGSADVGEGISSVETLFSRQANQSTDAAAVNILIINRYDTEIISDISQTGLVDCIIIPAQSDEPIQISDANSRTLVISEGRLGKYVGRIQITAPEGTGTAVLSFSSIEVTEDIPQEKALVELYKDYQRLVKDAKLLENYPRFILPDNLEYVGSKSCKLCHDYEYEKWQTSEQVFVPGLVRQADPNSRHYGALATLKAVGSDYDPECVVCHVVGMRFQSGFITEEKTPELKDVGCENCHGPGSEHLRSLGAIETSGPISTCTDCHTTEHSANYGANEKQYFEKIIHWREPLSRIRVAEPNRNP
jgi:hypothetical protein